MEPKYWMSGYTAVLAAALLALAARGFALTAGVIGLGIFALGAGLDAVYVSHRVAARLTAPRRRLDRIVRLQLLVLGTLGIAVIAVGEATGYEPLRHVAPSAKAIIIGAVVGVSTVYVSSLIDWYWIMPKVSGTNGPAPCEHSGHERWAGLTNVWFFHRAVATSVVIGILAGVPAYIAGHSGSEATAWALLGAALAVGYSSVNTGVRTALSFSFNAPIHVGDIIRVRANPEDTYLQDAYVVDVSIQGLKYALLDAETLSTPCFSNKGEQLSMEELAKTRRNRSASSPCPSAADCRAVNWYCHRNPLASTSHDPDDNDGVPTRTGVPAQEQT